MNIKSDRSNCRPCQFWHPVYCRAKCECTEPDDAPLGWEAIEGCAGIETLLAATLTCLANKLQPRKDGGT
jgi:hypothetical protein